VVGLYGNIEYVVLLRRNKIMVPVGLALSFATNARSTDVSALGTSEPSYRMARHEG